MMRTTKAAFDRELDRLGVPRAGEVTPQLPATDGRWVAIRRGDGKITGYLECWNSDLGWVSCPGASRVINAETGEIFEGDFA